jgi:hypothetical protein
MPGKLPIDRVRQNEFAPSLQEQDKQRFAEKQARLNNELLPPVDETPAEPASDSATPDDAVSEADQAESEANGKAKTRNKTVD